MGKAISYAKREKIIERRASGDTYKSIALDLGISESGTKKIWYTYQKEGKSALKPKYCNCGHHPKYDSEIQKLVNKVRTNEQGAAYIRSKLLKTHPDLEIPSTRTLQRWWVKDKTNRTKGRPTNKEKKHGVLVPILYGK